MEIRSMPGENPKALTYSGLCPHHQPFARITDIFEVEPNKMCIASHSHAFATVSFTPQIMQNYQCIFEATLDGLPRYQLPAPSSLSCSRTAGHTP